MPPTMVAQTVGQRIRALREAHDPPLSQAELAARAGLLAQNLYRIEADARDEDRLSLGVLRRIARALGVGLDDLAGRP